MASFIALKSGGADVLVNVENINFIKSHGQTATFHFTGGQDLVVNMSASEAFGMMQDAKQVPPKK
jgi:DNA-binding LytR/AlgR family response regulator